MNDLIATILRWGGIATENLGVLGWLDTPVPQVVLILYGSIIAILIYASWRSEPLDTRGSLIGVGYFLVLVMGVSAIMLYSGLLWQGRYVLPATAAGLLYFGLIMRFDREPSRFRHLFGLASVAWILSVGSALWLMLRHAFGILAGSRFAIPNVVNDAFWLPPIGGWGGVALTLIAALGVPLLLLKVAPKPRESRS